MNKVLALVLACISFSLSQGQKSDFFPLGTVNPSIPTPEAVLGYRIGERFTDYRNLERYMEKLAASSERVKRVVYGETYEHRPLQLIIISSSQNLARLQEIRTENLQLTDPRTIKSRAVADRIVGTNPSIVWLSYGVHGNEASSPEAAIATAYQLCAGTDPRTQAILDNVVTIIDPSENPDGRERYVRWVNGATSFPPNAAPGAYEHREPWPGGRTNHYYFDLNRDWAWQTQQETQARIKIYREWMPHVHVDFHEMGYNSTYFFFPAAPPFHEALPTEAKKWGEIYGKGNAEAFDKDGIPYFVGEVFDMFHPGYGDSWPTFNGAIGMTYEQAGGAGLLIKRSNGQILSLRDRARNHFTTGIATLETTVKHKKERIQDFLRFWQTGTEAAGRVKGYVVSQGTDPRRAGRLTSILMAQGIEVHQLQEQAQLDVQRFYSKRGSRESFARGTFYVSLSQPQSRLARALLEPHAAVKDTFFYDVSAWSLPIAYGLDAYSAESPLPPTAKKLTEVPQVAGSVKGGAAQVAYLIPWDRHDAMRLTWQLLERSYTLHYATRQFETMQRSFGAGTVIAFVSQNNDSLHADIQQLASTFGVEVFSTNTGLTEKGISLGSRRVMPIKKTSIAVLTDSPVFSNNFGQLWFLFEREFKIPFTAIRATDVKTFELDTYGIIIIPSGGDYGSAIDSAAVDKLRRWVQQGGTLIGIDEGARFLAKSRPGLTAAVLQTDKKEDDKSKEEKDREKAKKELTKRQTLFEKQETQRLDNIPGTIFRALIDTTHPIGFGMPHEMFVFKGNGTPVELSENGHTVARFSKDTTEVSGYAFPEKARKTAETTYIQDFRIGRGHAILFTEDVAFRMFWIGLNKLLMNAMLFVPEP
ncbi:MAG: hypothetical protein HYY49_06060 [Ignavibacteriales bacterium]|nr:hypothetical protein [Ignavibacteriales bacterium]